MKKILLIILYSLGVGSIFGQSLDSLSYKQILDSIEIEFLDGDYNEAIKKCWYILSPQQDEIPFEIQLNAYYYAKAISIFNGDETFVDFFRNATVFFVKRNQKIKEVSCNNRVRLRSLHAEHLFEKRHYKVALDSLLSIQKDFSDSSNCSNKLFIRNS